MYEGCLSAVPLIHNHTINVTYPVTIWALQSSILNRLLQRKRSVLPNERVRNSTSLSVYIKMSLRGNAQSIYTHTDIVNRNNSGQSVSIYRNISPMEAIDNVKLRLTSMLSSRRRFPGVAVTPDSNGRARSESIGTRWRTGREVKGKLANGVGSQYSHPTSERSISSITQADAHTSAASSRLNWRPHRFKWTRPFRGKTKSGFCACVITYRTSYTE